MCLLFSLYAVFPPIPYVYAITTPDNAVVIAVELSDAPHVREIRDLRVLFDTAKSYYLEASYGTYSVDFTIFGWYKSDRTTASYGRNSQICIDDPPGDGSPDTWHLVQDAIDLTGTDIDFSHYKYLIVVHSGSGEECTGISDDIWSCAYLLGIWFRTKQCSFSQAAIVPETQVRGGNPIGVYVHEFGHLFGLPDLYSINEQLGPWDVMGRGTWRGYPVGAIPALFCAWSRIYSGWLNSTHIHTFSGRIDVVELSPLAVNSAEVKAIKIPLKDSTNYYLIEYRIKVGFDSALPESGILITRIGASDPRVVAVRYLDRPLDKALWPSGSIFSDPNENLFIGMGLASSGKMEIVINIGSIPPIFTSPISIPNP